ncbi:alpha/beta hydrolase [Cellulomonas soli]
MSSPATDRPPLLQRCRTRARAHLARLSPAGLIGALILFAAALGPSLTPRGPLFQGAAAGACAVCGYGIGAFVGWVLRATRLQWVPSPVWQRRLWWGGGALAVVVVVASLIVSNDWQHRLRDLMGMEQPSSAHSLTILVVALVVAWLVLTIARGLRRVARAATRLAGRWLPPVAARALAVTLVAVGTVLLLDGTLVAGSKALLSATYGELDAQTYADSVQPQQPERSGSPQSLSSWESLGREGRRFVSGGRTTAELAEVTAKTGLDLPVVEPIRVYAGLRSGDSLEETAQVVVDELDRTDAWDREALVVWTTTGTGWVDPSSADALEMLWGGNTAIAAMQYSYLPSWVSFVGDRGTPPDAGKALFEAVRARWEQLPPDDRPKLYVFGISLGSYGSQGAFSSLQDLEHRVDGAVWAGTPGFTPLWQDLTAARDAGSTQVAPVLDDGETVRWGLGLDGAGDVDLWSLGTAWDSPRVVYLQHASDGVIWWSPDLLLHRPDWLAEPRGPDVLPDVTWFPVASFWQLSIDLFVAGETPPGHGHNYHVEYADAWAAVATPPGWTDQATLVLRAEIAATESVA